MLRCFLSEGSVIVETACLTMRTAPEALVLLASQRRRCLFMLISERRGEGEKFGRESRDNSFASFQAGDAMDK